MNTHTKAYTAALSYTFIIGFALFFVKIALTVGSPLDTLAHRFTVAIIVASVPIWLGKVRIHMKWKDILSIFPLALLYPTLFFMLQAFGLVTTSSSEAGIITATTPIMTMLLASLFLKERTSHLQKFFMFLSVTGVIYIFVMKGFNLNNSSLQGTFLVFLSTLSTACYSVLARKLVQRIPLYSLVYVMTIFGFIIFNGVSITQHIVNHSLSDFITPLYNIKFIGAILYLGILSSLVTSFCSAYALSKISASKMSVFSNLTTFITVLAGVIFLNESLQLYHLIGGIIILTGVIGVLTQREKHRIIPMCSAMKKQV
ncbi:DMT family transporter [Hazenella sp. IB182353]|uniref:DMT family transporter n=1 Tax=Polycladospora coralii TaxID=2771432 RepID=UPI001747806B|nr:DMT family transporter [Polycladospora coralii]MBS7532003.1 DMT family transporter [Polycladospora coralii]